MPELSDDQRRILIHQAELFVAMAKTDAWTQLQNVLEQRRGKLAQAMLARFTHGGEIAEPVDQRLVDYNRGFVSGMLYLQAVIDGSAKTLEGLEASAEVSEPDDNEGTGDW